MSTGVEQQRDRSDSFNQKKEIVQNLDNEKQFNPSPGLSPGLMSQMPYGMNISTLHNLASMQNYNNTANQ